MRQILFVTRSPFLPGLVTGENVSMDTLCRWLQVAGHDPIVVCAKPASGTGPAGTGPASPDPGYTVLRLDDPVAAMFEMIGRLEPDAVVIFGIPTAVALQSMPAAHRRRLHFQFTFQSYRFAAPPEAPQWRYAANSRFLADCLAALLGTTIAVLPPAVEPARYRCTPTGDSLLFVNPTPAKGAHLVAALARRLLHRHFLIAHSWPASAPFRPIEIAGPNIEHCETTNDMRAIYARTKLVLMPSMIEETWGRIVSEAQVSGIPALASDRGGLPEAVGPGGRLLSLDEPPERWADAIEAMYGDPALYAACSDAAKRHAARADAAREQVLARFLAFLDT